MNLSSSQSGHQVVSPVTHSHQSIIFCVRACTNEDALDLLAIGGEQRVEILQRDLTKPTPSFRVIASMYVGCTVTSLAWSPRTVSPSVSSTDWLLELVAAGSDNNLRLLVHCPAFDEKYGGGPQVREFGGGLSGHHGRINDICFCSSETYKTNVASVGDDGFILWNLYPQSEDDDPSLNREGSLFGASTNPSRGASSMRDDSQMQDAEGNETEDDEQEVVFDKTSRGNLPVPQGNSYVHTPLQPTAYNINFSRPLHSISSHPNSANQFMVSDSRGTVFIVDWTALDPTKPAGWRGHRVVELIDPRALTDGLTGVRSTWTGGASWKPNDVNMIGATYGTRWVVWDLRKLQGGKPIGTGESQPHGGHRFRWCTSNPHLFAISTQSPLGGAVMKVHTTAFPHSPRTYNILPSPHRIRDFDWLAGPDDATRAWMAVAIGQKVFFVAGGDPLPAENYQRRTFSPQP